MSQRYFLEVYETAGWRYVGRMAGYGRARGTWGSPALTRRHARRHADEYMARNPRHYVELEPAV